MPSASSASDALAPGFLVVHGNQLESLRDLAVSWMRREPLAPLENEVILVQSNGISQWLKLALAADAPNGSGIAAALDITLPARFLWQAYRAVLTHSEGEDAVPEASPLDKPRLNWRLMRLLPELLNDPAFKPLDNFLADDNDLRKRFQLAERLADLFDQYQVYRADWLAAWAEGRDEIIDARGQTRPLEADQCWQPELWRRLRDDIGNEGLNTSRALIHQRFLNTCRTLQPGQRPAGLPRRVIVFGISSLPRQTLEALAAMSRVSQVLLCVHNPCRHFWADIIEHKDLLRAERRRQRQRPGMPQHLDDTELHLHAQPLLAAWGKQGRDYLRLLDEFDNPHSYKAMFDAQSMRIDLFNSPQETEHASTGLLQQLQDDILELRPPHETRVTWPAVDPQQDHSLRFHVAHSALREVEILHDQLLAAFDADPSLRPRDILVMVPDIDAYAAAVQAVFGRLPITDPRHIPFTLSDQASRHRQPLLIALESLLHLPESRLTVSDLLDLVEVPALRQRFSLDIDDLPTLRRWIEEAGIRWGLNAQQRANLDLPNDLSANTWAFGLRRLLLGYAVGDTAASPLDSSHASEPWHNIEPYGDIGGLEATLIGPLSDLLDTLHRHWQQLSQSATVDDWCQRLRELLADCFAPSEEADLATLARLEEGLEQWQEATEDAGLTDVLPLSVVREHWLAEVDQAHLSQRFLAGAVNVATLMPMRAIPFRHVCLLGMNDEDYPRIQRPLDIDLMGQDYRPGDRSRRDDDRYLFLEALLSARERLLISWVGRSIHDNEPQPPSVLLGQLRDHIAASWRLAGTDQNQSPAHRGKMLLAALTVEHPLQPFSRAYFQAISPTTKLSTNKQLFSYAKEWHAIYTDASGQLPHTEATHLPAWQQEQPLTLSQLGNFLKSPAKAFFNTRLGVYLETDDTDTLEHEPFDLNGLSMWQLQEALVDAGRIATDQGGHYLPAVEARLQGLEREGRLAMGGFAERMRVMLTEPLNDMFTHYAEALTHWPHPIVQPASVNLSLGHHEPGAGSDYRLEDWLDGLRENDNGEYCRLVLMTSSLVRKGEYQWRNWVTAWVAHLAGQLAVGPMSTRLISRAGNHTLTPMAEDDARHRLNAIFHAWQSGMNAPLPLPLNSAFMWLKQGGSTALMQRCLDAEDGESSADGEVAIKAWNAAQKRYEGDDYNAGERDQDPYLAHQWPNFERIALARAGERRFSELAEVLYAPLHDTVKATPAKGDKS
ncbi:exodeoxyribonuclease V subunit gamma [Halomonas halocynthiae]|uniref:exodeoxyribonuclease V subunit gamma n=1 Tax=Halomonas halocynthiae TaxID=176290 RepID=UPI00040353C1|nr:exodeoxyribonuclease V subunit gamma [Halomonas halocynthiae]